MTRLRRFVDRPRPERPALVEASALLALARAALLVVSFRRLSRWLGEEGAASAEDVMSAAPDALLVFFRRRTDSR